MQHITNLSDNYKRLHAEARSLHPQPEDSYQRLNQLYTSVRNAIDELRRDCVQYTYAMEAWDVLALDSPPDADVVSLTLLQHRRFFGSAHAPITKPLDEKQMDLLEYYNRTQQRIEDIIQHREEAARATRSRSRPADNAGGCRALLATEQQRTNLHREKQPPSTDAPDEQRPPTHRKGRKTARGGALHRPQRSEADNATAAAPSRSLEADNAARLSRGRGPSPDHSKALMSSFASSAGAGWTTTSSSGPLQVGADGTPFSRSHADAKQPSSFFDACALCNGPHSPSQCPRYDTTAKRLRRVLKIGYCLLCLGGDHPAGSCPNKTGRPCCHCGHGEHHPALCKDLHRRCKDEQPGRMRATTSEHAPKATASGGGPTAAAPHRDLGGPSSPIRSELQPIVIRQLFEASPGGGRPSTLRFASAHQVSSDFGKSNSQAEPIQPSRDPRTDPDGLHGTSSPTTGYVEGATSKDAYASGPAEYLLQQKNLRVTNRRSTAEATASAMDEMVQFDRTGGGGTDSASGGEAEDGTWGHELHEDVSPTLRRGQLNDGGREKPINEHTSRFAPTAQHREDDATKPLLECLLTIAKNPWTDDSCDAVIVFDRFRTTSIITKELVRMLKLPAASTPTADFTTFTGYHTCVDLLSRDGFRLSIDNIATGRLPQQVRTVLVDEALLRALRRRQDLPDAIDAQPHLLIGLDLMFRVQYRHGPRLQGSLYPVHTRLGVAIGGTLHTDSDPSSKASTSSCIRSASVAAPPLLTVPTTLRAGSRTIRLRIRNRSLADYTFGQRNQLGIILPTMQGPADNAGDTAVNATTEHLDTSTTATFSSEQLPTSFRVTGALPPSTQKQPTSKPLDTQPLRLPTTSSTYAAVEGVSEADNATELPRPIQEPSSSTQALLQHNQPPTHGESIRASLNDAGSLTTRKTRLRYRLPHFARQLLGIYTAPEPVPAVSMLNSTDTTSASPLRAERELLRTSSVQNNILPTTSLHFPTMLDSSAVLTSTTCATSLNGPLRKDASTDLFRTPSGSRRECSCDLRSERGLPTHARVTPEQQPSGPAHQQPPARNAHTPREDASQRLSNGQQPAPQPLTSWPTGPPSTCLPQSLPPSATGRVRIDPTLVGRRPKDAIHHTQSQGTQVPAASLFFSSAFHVQASRIATDISQSATCCNFLNLAATSSSMVKKNKQPKDYMSHSLADEDYDDENPGVIREADGTLRATRPGEVQQILVGREAAITPDPDSDEDASRRRRQRATAPADNAGGRHLRLAAEHALSATQGLPPTMRGPKALCLPPSLRKAQAAPANLAHRPPEKDAKPSAKKTSHKSDSPTPAELAALEEKYTIAEARRLRDVPTTTWIDADFRKEIENFWENWRVLNAKTEGTTPKAWTGTWETHKCGKHLWARYQKFQSTFLARTVSSQRTIVQTATTREQPSSQPHQIEFSPHAEIGEAGGVF